MIPRCVRRAAVSDVVFANNKAKRLENGFRIELLHPTDCNTPLIGAIDLVGGHSLPFYRRHTEIRRCLPRRYPEKNAGFSAVCEAT